MADKNKGDPRDDDALSSPKSLARDPSARLEGDASLSAKDHRILEDAIRGRVSRLVGATQPGLSGPGTQSIVGASQSGDTPPELDLRLHPELDPLSRQLPGTEKAISYRQAFMKSLIDPDPRSNREMIAELQRAGIPMHTLAIQLFGPVAAKLGNLWCADEADFMQVAVASMRLSMIINHLSQTSTKAVERQGNERRVLLARTRGAMHTIGVTIVATCFRDMGWIVDGGIDLEVDDELYNRLSATPYDLLGISVGKVDEALACSEAITRVHSNPRTQRTKIAVGGPAVVLYPDAFADIGADIVARSALDVMQYADRLQH